MKVSIVIPVYNEAEQLGACLSAIAAQTVRPFEIIVVDNNSTDETVSVAGQFEFVKLLRQPKQGVLHARTTGFDAARGDIIARIDADSLVAPDWVETIIGIFSSTDIDAVSGSAQYYNVARAPLFDAIDLFFRRRLERQLGNRVYLWGANMALRRRSWHNVRPNLCHTGRLHEDYDIAIHLQEMGGKVGFDEHMQAQVSSRRIDMGYLDFLRYVLVSPGTYAMHNIRSRWHMYEVVIVCALGYLPAKMLHRGYDPVLGRFSWRQLIIAGPALDRVDPTTNIV